VEKVLKPPQKPTVQNSLAFEDIKLPRSASPTTHPKIKQAITLIIKVANGNVEK
jgi:hypothetical protein